MLPTIPTKKSLDQHLKIQKLPSLEDLPVILKGGISYEEGQRLLNLVDEVPIIQTYWRNLNKLHDWWEDAIIPDDVKESETFVDQYYAFEDACDEIYEEERKKYTRLIEAKRQRPTSWIPDYQTWEKHPSKITPKEFRRREREGEVLRPQPRGPTYLKPDLFYLKLMPLAQIDYILNNLSLYRLSEKCIASIKLEKEKIENKTDGWHP